MRLGASLKVCMSEAFVLLHGFAGRARDLDGLKSHIQSQQPGSRILTPDLYYEKGLTPQLHLTDWISGFDEWLRAQGVTQATLVGYSMGGRLALNWSLKLGASVRHNVIAVSSRPGVWSQEGIAKRRAFDQEWAEKFRQLDFDVLNQQWQQLPVFERTLKGELHSEIDRELLAQSLLNWSPARHVFTEQELERAQSRCFWVYGAKDKVYDPVADQLRKRASAQVFILPNAGHRVHKDDPAGLADVISEVTLQGR